MSSTQTAITIAATTSIATALLIYLLLRPQRRGKDVRLEQDLRRSDDGRKIQEESLMRRRAAVLGKNKFSDYKSAFNSDY